MSTPALSIPLPRRLRAAEIVADWFAGMADGLRIARRYRELSSMTDSELAAIGLTRHELPQVAVRSVG